MGAGLCAAGLRPHRNQLRALGGLGSSTACCELASSPALRRYDLYLGDGTAERQADPLMYASASSIGDRKYGWVPFPCIQSLASLCEVPASSYPCQPPPSPPPLPPSPPPPPYPPAPPSCERPPIDYALASWPAGRLGAPLHRYPSN